MWKESNHGPFLSRCCFFKRSVTCCFLCNAVGRRERGFFLFFFMVRILHSYLLFIIINKIICLNSNNFSNPSRLLGTIGPTLVDMLKLIMFTQLVASNYCTTITKVERISETSGRVRNTVWSFNGFPSSTTYNSNFPY